MPAPDFMVLHPIEQWPIPEVRENFTLCYEMIENNMFLTSPNWTDPDDTQWITELILKGTR